MTSQLLFGEKSEVLEKYKSNWVRVRTIFDGYEGWMDPKQLEAVEPDDSLSESEYSVELIDTVYAGHYNCLVSMGSCMSGFDGMLFTLAGETFRFSGQVINTRDLELDKRKLLVKLARKLLHTPYLWGGRSSFGIDCSGLTQLVYKCAGIALNRDSGDQAKQGSLIDFYSEATEGDLAFFSKDTENISHVGIILDENKILHASGSVRIDHMDHYGIFNETTKEYTHRLKMIRKFI